MIKKATQAGSAFAGGTVTSVITSTVNSGNAFKCAQGGRLSLGSDSRYFSDDGTNINCTGGFFPSATVSFDMGSAAKFWGTAFVHAVQLNSGQIRDSAGTARINIATATGIVRLAKLGVDNNDAGGTPGTCIGSFEVYDSSGNSIGLVPLYDTIS